jgi:L-2-hydroxyglutarate oxidase LhgO
MGGEIEFNQKVDFSISGGEIVVSTNNKPLKTKQIINAAGAQSDLLGRSVDVGTDYLVIPFKGNYRKSNVKSASKRLIYPVPHEINPFLGVHTSLTTDGFLKIGPTAIPALGRENYKGLQGIKFSELSGIVAALKRLARSANHDLVEMIKMELPLLKENQIIKSVSMMMNEDLQVYQWTKTRSGIRSQLINIHTGDLVQDFIVEKKLNSMHFLNVVSPGWTSALPFTRNFVNEFIL